MALGGDDTHRNTCGPQPFERLVGAREGPDVGVMDGHVVLAVGAQQVIGQGFVAFRKVKHLVSQGRADAGHEHVVGQGSAQLVVDGVAHGGENDVVGVDERAVLVEQDALDVSHGKPFG